MHLTLNSCVTDLLKWLIPPAAGLRFFVGRCLAFERDLLFLRQVQEKSRSEDRDG
jgi:hypothetical protein